MFVVKRHGCVTATHVTLVRAQSGTRKGEMMTKAKYKIGSMRIDEGAVLKVGNTSRMEIDFVQDAETIWAFMSRYIPIGTLRHLYHLMTDHFVERTISPKDRLSEYL